MDRRATLALLTGRQKTHTEAFAPVTTGLEPYSGPWDYPQVLHLLRRATFGPNRALIEEALTNGLTTTIEQLFAPAPLPEPPINYYFENDPFVNIGETWIDAPYNLVQNLQVHRNRSLRGWTLKNMLDEGISIREKMTLFWHNHFAINNEGDPKVNYRYITTLRSQATGNFKQLVKDITIDPAMLVFLNGNQNHKNAPNENYARELLELFTVGKGPLTGPGDYTTFTEEDVQAMARVLTGWRVRGRFSVDPTQALESYFTLNRHDVGDKQLSHRFGSVVIGNGGEEEYAQLIDVIFQQEVVAYYIARKFYRWFVYYQIDDNAEENVIAPMAQMLIDNDYDVQPALEALLSSAHFFDMQVRGPMIKNPLDYIFSIYKGLELGMPDDLYVQYEVLWRSFQITAVLEMIYYDAPSVAGWKAWYQEPQYYRTWINSTTLQFRALLASGFMVDGYMIEGQMYRIDPLELVASFEQPEDIDKLLDQFALLFFPMPLTDGQKIGLKQILIPGLPDFEWTVEFSDYLANPDDEQLAAAVESKLRTLMLIMLNLAEFHLI